MDFSLGIPQTPSSIFIKITMLHNTYFTNRYCRGYLAPTKILICIFYPKLPHSIANIKLAISFGFTRALPSCYAIHPEFFSPGIDIYLTNIKTFAIIKLLEELIRDVYVRRCECRFISSFFMKKN